MNEITAYWNELLRLVAVRGGVTYTELKRMDVKEFFVTLVNYEKEIDRESKANKEAINKHKKKR